MIGWVLGAFFAGLFGGGISAVILDLAGADLGEPLPFALVFAGQAAATFLVVLAYSRSSSNSLGADTGLVLSGTDWWALVAGMGLQIGVALVTVPLIEALFPDGAPSQGVADIAGGSETTLEIIAIFVSVAVLAPIIEEILYRGMLLSWINRFVGKWPSIILSAAVFSSIHLVDWNARAAVPGLFLVGVVLGWAAMRRGDLSLAIPLHAGVNMLAAILIVWGDDITGWVERQLDQIEQVNAIIQSVVGFF
jgi:hypothetical protein